MGFPLFSLLLKCLKYVNTSMKKMFMPPNQSNGYVGFKLLYFLLDEVVKDLKAFGPNSCSCVYIITELWETKVFVENFDYPCKNPSL